MVSPSITITNTLGDRVFRVLRGYAPVPPILPVKPEQLACQGEEELLRWDSNSQHTACKVCALLTEPPILPVKPEQLACQGEEELLRWDSNSQHTACKVCALLTEPPILPVKPEQLACQGEEELLRWDSTHSILLARCVLC